LACLYQYHRAVLVPVPVLVQYTSRVLTVQHTGHADLSDVCGAGGAGPQ
jgi:hypothetical protein